MSGNISARSAGRKSKNVEGACSRHAPAGHSMSLATTLFYCEVLQFAEPTPTRQDATNNMPMANSSQRKQKNSGKELEGITESEAIPMIRLFKTFHKDSSESRHRLEGDGAESKRGCADS